MLFLVHTFKKTCLTVITFLTQGIREQHYIHKKLIEINGRSVYGGLKVSGKFFCQWHTSMHKYDFQHWK